MVVISDYFANSLGVICIHIFISKNIKLSYVYTAFYFNNVINLKV